MQQQPTPPPIPTAPPPAAPPVQLADWPLRAYGALLDLAVWAGLITTFDMAFGLFDPLWSLMHLFGFDAGAALRAGTWALSLIWWAWQWGSARGRTGQSLGQKIIGIKVVDEESYEPIGPARSLLRSLTHAVDLAPACLGYARPVWTRTRTTWADKIHHTRVIVAR